MSARCLHQVFLEAAATHPERPALEVDGQPLPYAALQERAQAVAATLVQLRSKDSPAPFVAVLGQRSPSGFVGILGALCSGYAYVPLVPGMPPRRSALMLERSGAGQLVVDRSGMPILDQMLAHVPQSLTIVCLDETPGDEQLARWPQHTFVGPDALAAAHTWTDPSVDERDIAYLLFTSGSTGQPKGVMVEHRNICRFLDVVTERYRLDHRDRFSHLFDVTFDLSLFDLFGAWRVGGCLCCPTATQRMFPAQYIEDSRLSVWFSVPSTGRLMKETLALEPGAFPRLRVSLFCGEALPVPIADSWAQAAPGSIVENLYGPTELTLACTGYRWGVDPTPPDPDELVPIGWPFAGMRALVVDETLHPVAPGQSGELIMTGPQLARGYWNDPTKNEAAFVVPPGETATFYRTGDRVRRPPSEDAPLQFLGRLDSQIKLRGFRVELQEIEAVIRQEAQLDTAVVIGWPVTAAGSAEGIIAFIDESSIDPNEILDRVAARLPRYMVPRQIRVVERFPLNSNGKIDRNALKASLE